MTVWAISVLSFIIIHLPPGDYVTSYIASMSASGSAVSEGEAQALREQLGLDKPITVQYAKWMGLILQGNFGMAMEWGRPVADVIGDRLTLTMIISVAAIIFTWGIALPIGIYSAVKPYSFLDYAFTFIGFIGLAIPGFLLALVVMYVGATSARTWAASSRRISSRRPGARPRCGTSPSICRCRPSCSALRGPRN